MTVSKSQQKAVAKYSKIKYDEIKVRVPKGKKEQIQAFAQSKGKSLNAFMNDAIDETIKRDEGQE